MAGKVILDERNEALRMKIIWFGERVAKSVKTGMGTRLRLAAMLLRDRVVINISRPVTKIKGSAGERDVRGRFLKTRVDRGSRSKPGGYPKADTTRLMKDIFWEVQRTEKKVIARVGTTLDYGLILETRMKRKMLVASLHEMRGVLSQLIGTEIGVLPGEKGS